MKIKFIRYRGYDTDEMNWQGLEDKINKWLAEVGNVTFLAANINDIQYYLLATFWYKEKEEK